MTFDPATQIQDTLAFGEFGGVNPSITDSVTFTFMSPEKMEEIFEHEMEGCFLYSRHWNPINKYLADALAAMEGTESAQVTGSGMSAISTTLMQICGAGDEIISSRTIYGGCYALFKNFFPRMGINVKFVDITDLDAVKNAITDKTKVIYTEAMSNPLLEVANMPELRKIADAHELRFIVDNTFTPMIFSPAKLGADTVVYSMTKFVNGASDAVAGSICATKEFVGQLTSVIDGATMLLGPVLDSMRAASILKNMHTLHIRMQQHSKNGAYLAEKLNEWGLKVHYPGLPEHPQHELMKELMNPKYGFGGMLTLDAGDAETANKLMNIMQQDKIGYLAVSLGYVKTLFSMPGHSTSSEISKEEQEKMGMSDGLIRFSVGIDSEIEITAERLQGSLKKVGLL